MRKTLLLLLALLAVVAALGTPIPTAEAAGGTNCSYKCDCAGRALKCCPAGSTFCMPTSEFGCPQIYTC